MSLADVKTVKLVVVGDGSVGKTCCLIRYCEDKFPNAYIPTVFENYSTAIQVNSEVISVALWDTAGQEGYERLRPLSYPSTDLFLVCFSVVDPVSLNNVETKWIPELNHYTKDSMKMLVGLKTDLRNNIDSLSLLQRDGKTPVSFEQASAVADKIGAIGYRECCAKSGEGVKDLFDAALLASLQKPKKKSFKSKRKNCNLL
mmetsp:Transcript_7250/g.12713  ORF Transcript_7250/g.12713 Transcript_7250/m.12713 type:complete len:201 (-) Transcript_7250:38-640(-)